MSGYGSLYSVGGLDSVSDLDSVGDPLYKTEGLGLKLDPDIATAAKNIPKAAVAPQINPDIMQEAMALAKGSMPESVPFDPALAALLYFTKMGELASKKGASVFGSMAGAGVAPAAYLMQKEKEKAARDAAIGKTAISLAGTLSKKPKPGKPTFYVDPTGETVPLNPAQFAALPRKKQLELIPYKEETALTAKTSNRGGLAMYYADEKSAGDYLAGLGLKRDNDNFKRLVKRLVTEDPDRVGEAYVGPGGLAMVLLPTYLGNEVTNLNLSPVPNTQSAEYANKLKRLAVISKDKTAFLNKGFNVIPSINTALNVLMSGIRTGTVEERTMGVRNALASTFGLEKKELEGQQILESISNKLAPGMRPVGSGSTSDIEFNAFKSAVLSLTNTPFANYLSLWTLKRVTENSAKASTLEENLLSDSKNYSQKYVNDQINKVDRGLFSKFKTKDKEGNALYTTEAAKAVAAKLFFANLPKGDVFLNKDEDGQPVFTADGKSDLFIIKGFPKK